MRTLNSDNLKIILAEDYQKLSQKALELFAESAQKAIKDNGIFYLAISGGKTPRRLYELLGDEKNSRAIQWDKVKIFWVDERCVETNSPDSNYRVAAETFLNKVPIPPENIYRIMGESKDYNHAASQYSQLLREVFNLKQGEFPEFDLMILGMGPDGHIGSLLPNSYALFDTDDLVAVVYQMNGLDRITLTHPVMSAAKQLIVMVSGEEKARILHDVLVEQPDEVKYPVHTLWPILHKVTWLIDMQAAKYLQ